MVDEAKYWAGERVGKVKHKDSKYVSQMKFMIPLFTAGAIYWGFDFLENYAFFGPDNFFTIIAGSLPLISDIGSGLSAYYYFSFRKKDREEYEKKKNELEGKVNSLCEPMKPLNVRF